MFLTPLLFFLISYKSNLFETYSKQVKYYRIKNKQMPWGDYGNSLLSGSLQEENGKFKFSRTGPYIPPIIEVSLNNWIVTDEFKNKLEDSQLKGFSFQKVELSKIVRIHWEEWDMNADEPYFFPESGEPEDYIEERKNDKVLYANSGDFWRLEIEDYVELELLQANEWWEKTPIIIIDSWRDFNFATSDQILYTFIDQAAKEWLEDNSDRNLEFEEIDAK